MVICVTFSRNLGTHIGLPEDEASLRNSPSWVSTRSHPSESSAWSGWGKQWEALQPVCHPVYAGMELKHWPIPRAWEMPLRAILWKTFPNHQLFCTVPCPSAGYCPTSSPCNKSHLAECFLYSLNNHPSCLQSINATTYHKTLSKEIMSWCHGLLSLKYVQSCLQAR